MGGVFFLTRIMQKQAPHGTQSMGFCFYFLPPTPNPLVNPLSPPTALGRYALPRIMQKQAPHGTQSMGFCFYILFLPPTPNPLVNPLSPPTALGRALHFTLSIPIQDSCGAQSMVFKYKLLRLIDIGKFHLFRFSTTQILEPSCFPCKNLLLVGHTILIRSLK